MASGAAQTADSGRLFFSLDHVRHPSVPPNGGRFIHENEFESLESAHAFLALLAQTVVEAKRELTADVEREAVPSRRLDALQVALYNLQKLELHVNRTSRILNDLRTLRRFRFEERETAHAT